MKPLPIILGTTALAALAYYAYTKSKGAQTQNITASLAPQTKVASEKQMENLLNPDFTREKVPSAIANLLAAPVKFIETPIVKVVDQTTPASVFDTVEDKFIKSIAVTLPRVTVLQPVNVYDPVSQPLVVKKIER